MPSSLAGPAASPHPLVTQLRFARSEMARCLDGVTAEDATKRLGTSNCLSWIVMHLATQEQWFWVDVAQGRAVVDGLGKRFGFGAPPSTPDYEEALGVWRAVAEAADPYLDTIDDAVAATRFTLEDGRMRDDIGTMLLRNIWHYWYHTGEAHMIRQQLGHPALPEFIGRMSDVRWGAGPSG